MYCAVRIFSLLTADQFMVDGSRESEFSYTISLIRYWYNLRFTYRYLCAIDIYYPSIQLLKDELGLLRYYVLLKSQEVFIQLEKGSQELS